MTWCNTIFVYCKKICKINEIRMKRIDTWFVYLFTKIRYAGTSPLVLKLDSLWCHDWFVLWLPSSRERSSYSVMYHDPISSLYLGLNELRYLKCIFSRHLYTMLRFFWYINVLQMSLEKSVFNYPWFVLVKSKTFLINRVSKLFI